jgi:hypothetical protein
MLFVDRGTAAAVTKPSLYGQAVCTSSAFNNLPVDITNLSLLETGNAEDQVDAINSIDAFFPTSDSVVKRVYWFDARDFDFGGVAQTTGYLTNVLSNGRTLGRFGVPSAIVSKLRRGTNFPLYLLSIRSTHATLNLTHSVDSPSTHHEPSTYYYYYYSQEPPGYITEKIHICPQL